MKPFHLQISSNPDGTGIVCRWLGSSTLRAAEELSLTRSAEAAFAMVPDEFAIALDALLAEVAAGNIVDAPTLGVADELLPLRDLLAEAEFTELCEALYLFLWRAARAENLRTMARSGDGRVWIDPNRRLVRLWFATNRKRLDKGVGIDSFSVDESAETLSYGLCSVFIPESHKPGSTGTSWWRRWIRQEGDDHLELRTTLPLPENLFWSSFRHKLDTWWQPGKRNVFVLIHGFNVSFQEAAIRAAQLGYDLKLPGEIAFFSWPSRGGLLDYSADEATITASVGQIATFLHQLSEHSGAERIHLFVHSMGNRGFLAALERLAALNLPPLNLGQVFFCAPDEDVRTFTDRTLAFPQNTEQQTLLVSPDDRAVALSQWKHEYQRVGIVPPVPQFSGVETIQVTGFSLLELGHGYFASAEKVIQDMREAIETRKPAAQRYFPQASGKHFVITVQ